MTNQRSQFIIDTCNDAGVKLASRVTAWRALGEHCKNFCAAGEASPALAELGIEVLQTCLDNTDYQEELGGLQLVIQNTLTQGTRQQAEQLAARGAKIIKLIRDSTHLRHTCKAPVMGTDNIEKFLRPRKKLEGRSKLEHATADEGCSFLEINELPSEQFSENLQRLLDSPHFSLISDALFTTYNRGDEICKALAQAPHACALKALTLFNGNVSANGFVELAHSPYFSALESLSLRKGDCPETGLGDECVGALASSPFIRLSNLYIEEMAATNATMKKLATSPVFSGLKILDLTGNHINSEGIDTLVTSPQLSGLQLLYLKRNPLTNADLQKLADWKALVMQQRELEKDDTPLDIQCDGKIPPPSQTLASSAKPVARSVTPPLPGSSS